MNYKLKFSNKFISLLIGDTELASAATGQTPVFRNPRDALSFTDSALGRSSYTGNTAAGTLSIEVSHIVTGLLINDYIITLCTLISLPLVYNCIMHNYTDISHIPCIYQYLQSVKHCSIPPSLEKRET